MQFRKSIFLTALASLFWSSTSFPQEQPRREVEIHRNLKLIEIAVAPDIPEDIAKEFRDFAPLLRDSLKEITDDQSDECALTMSVSAFMKEIGTAKKKRAFARIAAFRRNSTREYVGDFMLYSYISTGPVNKEETIQFLKKQILAHAVCKSD